MHYIVCNCSIFCTKLFLFIIYWLLFVRWRLRLLAEKFFRLRARSDWDGVMACGVELAELSESESNDVARLCMLRDWVSLEFISANLVT